MSYKTVLFDLDGTLLDTNELIIASFLHTLEQFCPEKGYGRQDVIARMGLPLRDMLASFHDEQVEEMMAVYREHNFANHDKMVKAFQHVPEVLAELDKRGIVMGVVTTKQKNTVEMGLRLCQIERYMRSVVTIEDVANPKPHPEPVLKAMKELSAEQETTLMVGDSRYDIEAAKQAGIDSAGVAWSLKGEEYLRQYEPTYMLQDMRDLLTIVEG